MIVFYLIGFLLLCAATVILLGLTPESITDDLMRFVSPKQTLRDKVLIAKGKKKSRRLTNEILHIKDALDATGKGKQFTIACAASILLLIVGCIVAVVIDNYFMIPVLAVAFACLPFTDTCSASQALLATVLLLMILVTLRYLSSLIFISRYFEFSFTNLSFLS